MECILYADDIVLLSSSFSSLQSMLNICETFSEAMVMKYNCKKCMVIRIGLHCKCEPLQLRGVSKITIC